MSPSIPICSRLLLRILSVLTLSLLAWPSGAWGQSSYTWNGNGGNSNFGTGGNWVGGSAPSSLQSYINFAGTNNTTANNNYTAYSSGYQIYFNSGAGAFTVTGNAINFYNYGGGAPTIENDSSNLQTVQFQVDVENGNSMNIIANTGNLLFNNSAIYLDGNSSMNFTANAGKTITVSEAINSSTNGITIGNSVGTSSGAGTVIFAGTNTYVGSTSINGGTLQLGNGGSTGSIASGNTIYFNVGSGTSASSGTLAINLTSNATITNTLTMNSSSDWANVSVASGTTGTLSGAITGAGEFWATGTGNLVIADNAGSATRSASNVVASGTLSVSDFTSSTLGTGGFYVTSGTLNYTGASTSTTRIGNFALQAANSTIGVASSSATLTLTNDLGGFSGGGLTKSGPGALALTASNTYTGGTTVIGGSLIASNTSGSATGTGSVTVSAGGTLGGYGTSSGAGFSISGTGTATGSRANVMVGMNSATDTNTAQTLSLIGSATSTITNANLTFNISAATKGALGTDPSGSGTELNVGATKVGFGAGLAATTLTLNVENEPGIIAANTPYVLIAGSLVTGGGGVNGSQYTGLTLGTTLINSNGITESIITGSNLQVAFGTTQDGTYYSKSYLVLYQNTNTGVDDIDVIVVPEPGAWAMMLGGLAILIFWQRSKRKR
jgi:fibronectin-binding autotransporter adhesin